MSGETLIGYLLGRMLPDLPLIPLHEPEITTDGDGTAVITWQREYAIGGDGQVIVDGDHARTIERPARIVLTARIERGDDE